jgi:hypothetical protein
MGNPGSDMTGGQCVFIQNIFSKSNSRWAAMLLIAPGILSCVTDKVNSLEAEKYSERIGKTCVTQTTVANYTTSRKITQEVEIFSINKSKNGWTIIDASVIGIRDNIYHNEERSIFVCGATNFREKGYRIER